MQSKTYIQTSRSYTSPSKGNLGWKEVPMPKIIQTRPSSNEDVSSGKYYDRTIKKKNHDNKKNPSIFYL